MRIFKFILCFLVGILVTLIVAYNIPSLFKLSAIAFCLLACFLLCFLILSFLTVAGLKSQKDYKAPLNLPAGSVRAIIAIVLVVFFFLSSIVFYFLPVDRSNELGKQILTILGTLVTAVCSFYFGSKATEQGQQLAQEVFKTATGNDLSKDVPLEIIQEAIDTNKAAWISQYSCIDIIAGKKIIQGTTQDLNCIIFIVTSKDNSNISSPIPRIVMYNSKGKDYTITTDVQLAEKNQKGSIDDKETEKLMREAINENYSKWKTKFPNIIGCTVSSKVINGKITSQKAIVFKVDGKPTENLLGTSATIPKIIEYKGIPLVTDVIDTVKIKALAAILEPGTSYSPARLGTNVSRGNHSANGTAGLKVKIPRSNNSIDYYLLSCFHVLYPEKLNLANFHDNQITANTSSNTTSSIITIPSAFYRTNNGIQAPSISGYIRTGILSPLMDAAIAMIEKNDLDTITFDGQEITGEISTDHLYKGMVVFSYGCMTRQLRGEILDVCSVRTDVILGEGSSSFNFTFHELIEISNPCTIGDSGAPVLTSDGKVIGIVTSGNGNTTFVLPFSYIKNVLHVNLETK